MGTSRILPASAVVAASSRGDVTGDALINVSDFLALNSAFGNACSDCWADINGNGTVAVGDFLALNSAFRNSCN